MDTRIEPGRIPTDWSRRAKSVAVVLFLLSSAFILTKTGRDALYFQEGGLFDLPKAYLGIAALALPAALAMLTLMRTLGPRRARVGAGISTAKYPGPGRLCVIGITVTIGPS